MYRKRHRISKKMQAAMQAGKARVRLSRELQDYPPSLPNLRRRIIVVDYDHGRVVHRLDLYKTNRIDCYRAVADGVEWKPRIGWAKACEAMRKTFLRVQSSRNL